MKNLKNIRLKTNVNKTKVMCPEDPNITINNIKIENVKDYVYFGQQIILGKENKDKEIE